MLPETGLERKGFPTFLIITFAITYALEGVLILSGFRFAAIPSMVGQLVVAVAMWVPTIATIIIVKFVTHEKPALGNLHLGSWRPYVASGIICAFGVGLALLGVLNNTWLNAALLFVLGIGNGYISIILITFLQRRAPAEMLGRMMSLILLANVGWMPISQAVASAVSKVSLEVLFIGAGACILLTDLWSALQPAFGLMDQQVANV